MVVKWPLKGLRIVLHGGVPVWVCVCVCWAARGDVSEEEELQRLGRQQETWSAVEIGVRQVEGTDHVTFYAPVVCLMEHVNYQQRPLASPPPSTCPSFLFSSSHTNTHLWTNSRQIKTFGPWAEPPSKCLSSPFHLSCPTFLTTVTCNHRNWKLNLSNSWHFCHSLNLLKKTCDTLLVAVSVSFWCLLCCSLFSSTMSCPLSSHQPQHNGSLYHLVKLRMLL